MGKNMKNQIIPSSIMFDNKTDEEKRLFIVDFLIKLINVNNYIPDDDEFFRLGQGSFNYEIPITQEVIDIVKDFVLNVSISKLNKMTCESCRSITINDDLSKLKKYEFQDSCWLFGFMNYSLTNNLYTNLIYLKVFTDDYGNLMDINVFTNTKNGMIDTYNVKEFIQMYNSIKC